jgi:hypothetical protein
MHSEMQLGSSLGAQLGSGQGGAVEIGYLLRGSLVGKRSGFRDNASSDSESHRIV